VNVSVGRPALSVVVVVVSDTTRPPDTGHLEPCLAALMHQSGAPSMEVIVPHLPGTAGIDRLRTQFPLVHFLEAADVSGRSGSREHHDQLRARGLGRARGGIVALTEDHGIPAPDWAARIVENHGARVAAVGGAIENGVDRPLNWAVYFCDFLRYQNPLRAGESAIASDANVAYKRTALELIRPVWEEVFFEPSVNAALRSQGETVALAPDVMLNQHRQGLRLGSALQERFVWGRSYAASRSRLAPPMRRAFWAVFSPALPALLLARMTVLAWKKRRTLGPFCKALPLTGMLLAGWACGECAGYLTGRANAAAREAKPAPPPARAAEM
jgi:hypothetical protein